MQPVWIKWRKWLYTPSASIGVIFFVLESVKLLFHSYSNGRDYRDSLWTPGGYIFDIQGLNLRVWLTGDHPKPKQLVMWDFVPSSAYHFVYLWIFSFLFNEFSFFLKKRNEPLSMVVYTFHSKPWTRYVGAKAFLFNICVQHQYIKNERHQVNSFCI